VLARSLLRIALGGFLLALLALRGAQAQSPTAPTASIDPDATQSGRRQAASMTAWGGENSIPLSCSIRRGLPRRPNRNREEHGNRGWSHAFRRDLVSEVGRFSITSLTTTTAGSC